ncbi:hypothetical protein HA402_004620 [Bradysia odoriphaga]|nr:hypothetical protein HA402_004620 [Bradysia odoriphaga]
MGTIFFNEINNRSDAPNEFESNTKDEKNSDKGNDPQTKSTSLQIRQRRCSCGMVPLLVSGLIFFAMGLLSVKFTITDMILSERLKMRPWSPAYKLWLEPQPEVRLNVYIFTVENANEFLNGTDSKIKMKEIGPIAYREYLHHQDVVHHDNSTLSYTAFRRIEFIPHANIPGILNKTITVPNFAVLAAASFVNEYNYFIQIGYKFLHKTYSDGLFINITVYDYLWNYRSKLIEKAEELVPSMVPTTNCGILHGIYAYGPDRYNVKIGTKYGDSQFFQINTVNGAPTVPGYDVENGDCYASVENSTEGAMYRQRITKGSVLTFWRKALCRTVDLYFEKEMRNHNILTYKYTLGPDMFDRKPSNETDCYKGKHGELPNGLTDVSKCYFNMPFAASQPHFYGRTEEFAKKFEGLSANEENHSCFTIVEPTIGAPMIQAARSQVNLVIPKFGSLFEKDYQLFSDMILPMFWLEFSQKDLTAEIIQMVGFVANVLPTVEVALTCFLFLAGFTLTITAFVKLFNSKWKHLAKNRNINFPFVQRGVKPDINCDTFK